MFNTFVFNKVAFNKRFTVVDADSLPPHIIWEASYEVNIPQVNRAFVVGEDLAGSLVTGNAITLAEVDLVGERLEVQHNPAAITAVVAAGVAAAVLAKNRLDGAKGHILIPPHCGLELWDIINIIDEYANQSCNYRIVGYEFEINMWQGKTIHKLDSGQYKFFITINLLSHISKRFIGKMNLDIIIKQIN